MREVSHTMEAGSAKVQGIETVASAAASALQQIASAVGEVHGAAAEVEREAVANRGIVEELGIRTQEVSQAASEHASASEQVTAAAEEQSASTEEMAAAAGDLLQGATRLTALMQEFKTEAYRLLALRRLLDLHLFHRPLSPSRWPERLGLRPGLFLLRLFPVGRAVQPLLLRGMTSASSRSPSSSPSDSGASHIDQLFGVGNVELVNRAAARIKLLRNRRPGFAARWRYQEASPAGSGSVNRQVPIPLESAN